MKPIYHSIDYYGVSLGEVYRQGIGALFWVINIKADDDWNLAVSNDSTLTDMSESIRDSAIKFEEKGSKMLSALDTPKTLHSLLRQTRPTRKVRWINSTTKAG